MAISLKRERIPDEMSEFYGASLTAPKYQHRVIMRTSQVIVCTLPIIIVLHCHIVYLDSKIVKPPCMAVTIT